MRREILAALLLAACSGSVRTSSTHGHGTGATNGQGGSQAGGSGGRSAFAGSGNSAGIVGAPVCQDRTARPCSCPNGSVGIQLCTNSVWGLCSCGSVIGTGGSGPVCQTGAASPCQCASGLVGFQLCGPSGVWGICTCSAPMPGTGGRPNFPVCGDGIISGGEQCDGQNHNGQTCATVSMGACTRGYLVCTARCIFDYTACICSDTDAG